MIPFPMAFSKKLEYSLFWSSCLFLVCLITISATKNDLYQFQDLLKGTCTSISHISLISIPNCDKNGSFRLTGKELTAFIENFSFQKTKRGLVKDSKFQISFFDQEGSSFQLTFGRSKQGEILVEYEGDYHPLTAETEKLLKYYLESSPNAFYYELDIPMTNPPQDFKETFKTLDAYILEVGNTIDYQFYVKIAYYYRSSVIKQFWYFYKEDTESSPHDKETPFNCELCDQWKKYGLISEYEIKEISFGKILLSKDLSPYNSFNSSKRIYLFIDPAKWPELEKKIRSRNDIEIIENNLDKKTYQVFLDVPKEKADKFCSEMMKFPSIKSCGPTKFDSTKKDYKK